MIIIKNLLCFLVLLSSWHKTVTFRCQRNCLAHPQPPVALGTYSSNEELLAKVTSSKKGTYDIVFPSDYMVELMIEKDIIKPIDKNKIPNSLNIDETFLLFEVLCSFIQILVFFFSIFVKNAFGILTRIAKRGDPKCSHHTHTHTKM